MRSVIKQAAAAQGQKPGDFIGRTVVAAMERDEWGRTRQLTAQLQGLIVHHAPEDVLACAARILLDRRHPTSPLSRDADGCRPNRSHVTP